MLQLLPRQMQGLRVLDAACGTGRYLRHALQRGARRPLGVDLVPEMLLRAQELGVPLVQGRLEDLPIRADWADVTLCALALGYAETLTAALRELARVTRRGGLILCSELHPAGAELGWRRELCLGEERLQVRGRIHAFDDWEAAAQVAGLERAALAEPGLAPEDLGSTSSRRADPRTPVALVLKLIRG